MGFCTKEQHRHFLEVCPAFEKQIVDNGIRLSSIDLRSATRSRSGDLRRE
jgi:polyphosphate kinase 2 (PPK2 family)